MNKSSQISLINTPDLLILRLKNDESSTNNGIKEVSRNFLNELPGALDRKLDLIDSYPEANVTVWKVLGSRPSRIRLQVISEIRKLNDPRLAFVGNVRMRKDTKVYQIYTGNIFLCLHLNKKDSIDYLCKRYNLRQKQERVAKLNFNSGAYFVEANDGAQHVFEIANKLINNHPELVSIAEPELIVKRKTFSPLSKQRYTADGVPNPKESSLENILQNGPTALGATSDRSAKQSWIAQRTRLHEAQLITKGHGKMIAIIDDGIESSHPAFQTQQHNVISRDFLGAEYDPGDHQYRDEKHGTACASIAVSSDNLAPGVAPEAQLLVARTKGLGSVLEAEAISWAAKQGADVISCSWGPADGDPTNPDITPVRHPLPAATRLALKYASEEGRNKKGCLIVFAAGNGNEPLSPDEYANNPYVIAVGSTNKKDQRSSYSDYGPELFCCFPSSDIRVVDKIRVAIDGHSAADRLGSLGYAEGDYFHCFGGTSAAAPAVAGIATLVLSIAPDLKVLQLRHLLQVSCQLPNGLPGQKNREFGYGILDALVAVRVAQKIMGVDVPEEFNQAYQRLIKLSPDLVNAHFKNPKNSTIMKNKAISIHIGVDQVDPNAYPGSSVPPLAGCVNDAKQWMKYAESIGYENPLLLTNRSATREGVLNALSKAAKELKIGDICLLTYAGHGSQIRTDDPDEEDNYDETWLLSNGILLDDEIDKAASEFEEGVRLVIISDSCHSGTASRNVVLSIPMNNERSVNGEMSERKVASEIARSNYNANIQNFKKIKADAVNRKATKAFVKLLPGCQDQQTSKEKDGQGVFTSTLLSILRDHPNGNKKLNYNSLLEKARVKLFNYDQLPTVFDTGKRSAAFDNQFPLEIAIPDGLLNIEIHAKPGEDENAIKISNLLDGEDSELISESNSTQLSEDFEIIIEIEDSKRNFNANDSGSLSSIELFSGVKRMGPSRDMNVPYDQAYELLASNPNAGIKYIEIDQSSKVGASPQEMHRGSSELVTDGGIDFMPEYPYPTSDIPNRIIWHLGDEYTQLRKASLLLHPGILFGEIPQWNPDIPKVAMIDTGFRYDYLTKPKNLDKDSARSFSRRGKIVSSQNGEDRALIPEKHGHGTATANLLAGGFLSSTHSPDKVWSGIIGAAPQVKIIPLRISESVVILNPKAFASALGYAVNLGVDVVSMSMAGVPSNKMADAINEAYLRGVVVVSAGGNQWSSLAGGLLPDALMYPARFDRVIAAVGVAFDGGPYRKDRNTSDVQARFAGGSTMGSCYGPKEVNKTVIAAYTPNTLWAGGDVDKEGKQDATMTGGGTSTATPQVAAAAAMWLELHGKILDEAISAFANTKKGKKFAKGLYGLKWMRVEAVRYALFNSAKKKVGQDEYGKHFDHLYGNGVVQAYEALKYRPISKSAKIDKEPATKIEGGYIPFNIDEFVKAKTASVKFGGLIESAELLKSAYRAFGLRKRSTGASVDGYLPTEDELAALDATISAEIYSLLYSEETLRQYREKPSIGKDGILNPELALALLKIEDKLSETLRAILSPYAIEADKTMETRTLSRGSEIVIPTIFALKASTDETSNASNIIVVSDRTGIEVNNRKNPNYGEANDLQYEEFEINVNTERLRDQGPVDPLQLVIRPAKTQSDVEDLNFGALATLIERYDENGELIDFEWQYAGNKVEGTRSLIPQNATDVGPGLIFKIDLQSSDSLGVRGGGKLVKRIVGKVFKLFVKGTESKFGKEVHKSYQLRKLDMNASSLTARLGKTFDITNKSVPNMDLGNKGNALLLIHGTFATTESSFGNLLKDNDEIIKKMKAKYGGNIFAFEHPSVVESFDSNFENLSDLKKLLKKQKVDVVATSRGTHLARRMRLGANLEKPNNPLFDVDKAMYIGGTTFGTDLAQEENILVLLQRATGLMVMSSSFLGPQIASLIKLLEKVINKAGQTIVQLPGITDQVPGSFAVKQIAKAYREVCGFDNPNDVWVGANWQPSNKLGAKLINEVADKQIFGSAPNDGVAPLPGAVGLEAGSNMRPSNNRIILDPTEVHHFSYFLDKKVQKAFVRHILGQ